MHIITARVPEGVERLDEIHVTGGKCLYGNITVQGSKNTALPLMAAALLCRGISILKACPRITDVFYMEEILHALGARTWWKGHDLYLDCTEVKGSQVPEEYSGRMRSSIILLGSLLAGNGRAQIGYPGGCVIGKRPVDLHLYVLKCFGAKILEEAQKITVFCGKLHGAEIFFPKRSVGATEQAVLCAVLADGMTVLKNCAREPEIVWLCRFLNAMGAKIEGAGEECICIQGVEKLRGTQMQIPADRIVTGTYLCAAAATRGKIVLDNAPAGELDTFLEVYRKMGGQYEWNSGKLIADGSGVRFSLPFLETEVYPGFPTDLQSPLLAVLATVPGESIIKENIFENRFKVCNELCKMGADIRVDGNTAVVHGGRLHAGTVCAQELRGGAALLVAALAAQGSSVIRGCSFIRRGYEDIAGDIRKLGGLITEDTGTVFYENIQLQKI